MKTPTAKTGLPITIPAEFYNDLGRVVEWWRRSQALGGGGQIGSLSTGTDAPVLNSTGSTLSQWRVVEIKTYGGNNFNQVFDGILPSADGVATIGITQGTAATASGSLVQCRVAGVSMALVNVVSLAHKFAKPVAGSTTLVSADSGPVLLLGPAAATGNQLLLVRIDKGGDGAAIKYIKGPSGGIPRRIGNLLGSATCNFCDFNPATGTYTVTASTATVFNPISTTVLDKGDRFGRAAFFDGAWHVDIADCSDTGSGSGSAGVLMYGTPATGTYHAPIPT